MSSRHSIALFALLLALGCSAEPTDDVPVTPERPVSLPPPVDMDEGEPVARVMATVQTRPGGPLRETEMAVFEVPVDPPLADPAEVTLADDDLVLGVVAEGQAVAYPLRYLALYEVLNDHIGETHLTPTW